jgi:hypothetical protein
VEGVMRRAAGPVLAGLALAGLAACAPARAPSSTAAPAPCVATGVPPTEHPVASEPFRATSADGAMRFAIEGGGREPHGATATLRDAKTGRVIKTAPVTYDEYVEALGWVGEDVVLREHVDEGPGCVLRLVDPRSTWPIAMGKDDGDGPLIDCYGGNLVVHPAEGTVAIVGAGGESVTFVDEGTMATKVVTTGHSADPEQEKRLVEWLEGDELVIAYGAPEAGKLVRMNLKTQAIRESEVHDCPVAGKRER